MILNAQWSCRAVPQNSGLNGQAGWGPDPTTLDSNFTAHYCAMVPFPTLSKNCKTTRHLPCLRASFSGAKMADRESCSMPTRRSPWTRPAIYIPRVPPRPARCPSCPANNLSRCSAFDHSQSVRAQQCRVGDRLSRRLYQIWSIPGAMLPPCVSLSKVGYNVHGQNVHVAVGEPLIVGKQQQCAYAFQLV
jgi:hypothetical protein